MSKLINKAKFQKDSNRKEQIWKAAGSAKYNVAEGFDDGSSREFIRFLGIHKGHVGKSNRNYIVHWIVAIIITQNLNLFIIFRVNVESKLKVLESI